MIDRSILVAAVPFALCCSGTSPHVAPQSPEPHVSACELRGEDARHIVGGQEGVYEVDQNGERGRLLSKTPASRPRYLGSKRELLFFSPSTREVRHLDLDSGQERVVAAIPSHPECGDSPSVPIFIYDDHDFQVDLGRNVACLRLSDRNPAMSDYAVNVRVDLETRSTESAVWFSQSCGTNREAEDLFDCEPSVVVAQGGTVPDHQNALLPEGLREESRSPTGRWAVVSGVPAQGDHIFRRLTLLDTTTQAMFPLREGTWPPSIALDDASAESVDAVGESTILWLGCDRLVVDDLFVVAGVRARRLGGQVAR